METKHEQEIEYYLTDINPIIFNKIILLNIFINHKMNKQTTKIYKYKGIKWNRINVN